jgi:selT/selW/selH-like putative selenoprotein
MGAFEVAVDGERIFSKKEKGYLPSHPEIIEILKVKMRIP